MHQEVNKALYDAFSLEDKSDALTGYLYMKYTELFISSVAEKLGLPYKKLAYKVDEDIAEMMQIFIEQLFDKGATRETSIYHGKVVRLPDALKLVTQKENLHLVPSEKVMPFKVARDVILENPDSIVVGTCPCRVISEHPCLPPPMEVCFFIGDPNASFMAVQNPKYHKISPKEAVKILEDCHKRGFVHTAYFEKAASNRFNAICNCCSCCCLGIKMFELLGFTKDNSTFLVPSGYVAEVSDDCNGCGVCAENTCHFKAISMDEESQKAVINLEKCMGCGVCEDVCPIGAISLRREPSTGDPLDIEAMKSQR
jgi:ferredoxin